MNTRVWTRTVLLLVFGFTGVAAGCGDDSDNASDAGGSGKSGAGGKGGNGGSGGNGDTGGSASGSGGSGGNASTGGSGGNSDAQNMCTEELPTKPTTCGSVTCVTPQFENNPCVVPCCLEVNGQSKCGARSTSNMFPAACTLLAESDSACPAVENYKGCCNRSLGKCGIISTARPGCITDKTFVDIPDNTCSKTSPNDNDAGPNEPDAG